MPETENNWIGTKIRKGNKYGVVIEDSNGVFRVLTVLFEDKTKEEIWMANIGPDPESVHEFEWFCENSVSSINNTWVKF